MDADLSVSDPEHRWGRCYVAVLRRGLAVLVPTLILSGLFPISARGSDSLPVVRTVRQAHTLPSAEAVKGYPVHLAQAQVTFCDPNIALLFLRDPTDGIFADTRGDSPPKLQAGDLVEVDAVSGPGDVEPVLLHPHFRLLGHAPLPDAPLVSFDRLSTDAYDSQWVALEGIVRSVRKPQQVTSYAGHAASSTANLILTLASGQDLIDVITVDRQGGDHSSLVDAKVRLRAACGTRFNQRKQFIGVHVYMPDLSYVQIEESPPPDPFSLPVTDTAGVMRPLSGKPGHRVRIHGTVTSIWGSQQFTVMDRKHGIFVHTDEPVSLKVGDAVDVVGFPTVGEYTSVLDDSLYRRVGSATPPMPVVLSAAEGLEGAHDAEPVQVEGQLLYKSRTPSEQDLLLTENGTTFWAALPADAPHAFATNLQPGSLLRVTGICFIEVTPDKTPKALKILLQSPADVLVLARPSWWTPRNTLILSALLFALVTVVLAWNFGLRRRVHAQTRVIRTQLNEARALRRQAEAAHEEKSASLTNVLSLQRDLLAAQEQLRYQATHDVLTGLWNRGALLDLFRNEIERAVRTQSSLGVLMLDVDHFKPVNDTLGHLAGDAVLKEIALRISQAIRSYDLAGRYGGEEFLVLLPGCDRAQTEGGAERIRAAIASTPFPAAGSEISLTVSIGATVAPECARTETEILSLADLALYQAKSAGRNCTVLRPSLREEQAQTTRQ